MQRHPTTCPTQLTSSRDGKRTLSPGFSSFHAKTSALHCETGIVFTGLHCSGKKPEACWGQNEKYRQSQAFIHPSVAFNSFEKKNTRE